MLLLEVIEHLRLPDVALREAHRVLKPSGRLFLSVPFLYPIHDAPHDFRRYTLYGLQDILKRQGFRANSVRQHGNPIVASAQMTNLAILDLVHTASRRTQTGAILMGALLYPLTLAINLLAAPFLFMSWQGSASFGYFVVAERA